MAKESVDDENTLRITVEPWCLASVAILTLLKSNGLIDWSWWWVFSPVWIPFLVMLAFLIIVMIACVIAAAFKVIK